MRRAPDEPPAAEIASVLESIDETLAGKPLDPVHAEMAELVLLVAGERPKPADEFARKLDRRVENRFEAPAKAAVSETKRRGRRWWWAWTLAPAGGLAAVAAIVALIALTPGGSQTGSSASSGAAVSSLAKRQPGTPPRSAAPPLLRERLRAPRQSRLSRVPASPGLQPPANGRQLIQSSQLNLGAPPNRIDTVAQEVFNVVGAQNGFVSSSTVTATGGTGGYARFRLTVPSATLPQTMTGLSRLRYATVLSRTDKVEDVTRQLQDAKRRHDKARVRSLEHRIAYSNISLTVQADASGSAATHRSHGSGFTIGHAAHDALAVLTVIGGVLLIALAVLVPLAAVAALGWQLRVAIRRRQRERALDLA